MSTNPIRYCIWCGAAATADPATDGEDWRCEHCQRVTLGSPSEVTTQICPACQTAFPADAHYCQGCGTISAISPPSTLQTKYGLLPSPMQPMWPTKSWWQEDGEGLTAPPCPACGGRLRPDGAGSHEHIGYARPPWNAGWDGCCAACGQAVAVTIEQKTHFRAKRVVRMRPADSFHQTFIDEGMVFSGVRIQVEETQYGAKAPEVSEVFLSMGELMQLVRSLDTTAQPLLAQYDWSCDWT
ncbi:MAG: hypothetical protein WDN28_04585 [Chthoniobacter sp.]